MQFFMILLLVGLSVSEKLPSAPYPPSGWRPNGAILHLPPEYSPQRQRQPSVEVNKENVQYAGQLGETTTAIPNEYLPPSVTEYSATEYSVATENSEEPGVLRVQGLPSTNPPSKFNGQYNELNTGEIIFLNKNPNGFQQQGIRQNKNQLKNGRLQSTTFGKLNQQNQFVPQQQQNQFVPQQQQNYLPPQQQNYIPPQQYNPTTEAETPSSFQPDSENDSDEDNEGPNIAIANSVSNGQYYILGQDNTLQRVIYMTSQTREDLQKNGFTAQLRYEPIEPIRDPIYAYDNQGHLVKVYNK